MLHPYTMERLAKDKERVYLQEARVRSLVASAGTRPPRPGRVARVLGELLIASGTRLIGERPPLPNAAAARLNEC